MNVVFLAHGVGRGKTKTSLDMSVSAGVSKIMVYAPSVLKKIKHWENEAIKWGITLPIEVFTYHELQQYGNNKVNHKLPDEGEGVAIIIDEAQKVKNSQSLQGLGAFKLVRDNPKAVIYLLSGTPAPNGYQDFCNYAKMTGFVKHKTDFFDRYVITANYRGFPEVKGYRNTSELDKWWREIADIKPPKIFSTEHDITVDFPAVNDEIRAKKERIGVMDGNSYILENASQLTHFCRQIVAQSKIRQDWLENFLDSTDENVVVFTAYTRTADDVIAIAKRLKKNIYRVDGKAKILPEDDKVTNSVTIVNYQSGGAGLNLQYANHAVFYSPTYSYADYIQARGRISRRGQEKPCTFYHLQADRSIEMDIYECLNGKADFSTRLWNKKYDSEVADIIVL